MSEKEISKCTRQRAAHKGQVTQTKNFVDAFDPEAGDLESIRVHIVKLERAAESFAATQDELEDLMDADEPDLVERNAFDELYVETLAKCKSLLKGNGGLGERRDQSREGTPISQSSASNSHSSSGYSGKITLQKQQLPDFDGDYTKWGAYYDTMQAMVFQNPEMPDIQKFHITRQTLGGDARKIVDNLPSKAENFKIMLDMLVKRFEVPKLIIDTHLHKMLSFPPLTKESGVLIQQLLDNVNANNRAIELHKGNTYDTLLVHLLVEKFDHVTLREWNMYTKGKDDVKISDFTEFLTERCRILRDDIIRAADKAHSKTGKPSSTTLIATSNPIACHFCKSPHKIYGCTSFKALSPEAKFAEVKKMGLCVNCLGVHRGACNSDRSCMTCQRKHHTWLHFNEQSSEHAAEASAGDGHSAQVNATLHVYNQIASNSLVLLMTAVVKIKDKDGELHECRALLDSASQSCYITEDLVNRLQLDKRATWGTAGGLQSTPVAYSGETSVSLKSRLNNFEVNAQCYVIKNITGNMPQRPIDQTKLALPRNVTLADPEYYRPRPIDILLSMQLYKKSIRDGIIDLGEDKPCLLNSIFGWIVAGEAPIQRFSTFCAISSKLDVQNQLEKFWELEEVANTRHLSELEQQCERDFLENHSRADNGQLIVRYPVREQHCDFSRTKIAAISRLQSMERKFANNPTLKQQYVDFMREYVDLGHMSLVDNVDDSLPVCYLPHHAVMKEDSETTKLRVVFDGSCKPRGGPSLNDTLIAGPAIQDDLFSILVRFRLHTYVLGADVAKMYRRVWIEPSQRQLQLVVWRENPTDPINTYSLNTVTYGLAPSSFLATRCLQAAAEESKEQFPLAEAVVKRDFYVDDLLTGSDSLDELKAVKRDVEGSLSTIGFHLRKWVSNEPAILSNDNPQETSYIRDFSGDLKTLGLQWSPLNDVLQYKISMPQTNAAVTKRHILSVASQTFDPLGLVGPVIIEAKIILQKLWLAKLDWDDPVPDALRDEWFQYTDELHKIGTITIPRHVLQLSTVKLELHGFCDASELAYGACIYLRCWDTAGKCSSRLLTAKSRVAPVKRVTLPRLELCAAITLARLTTKTLAATTKIPHELYFWGDSTIALSWIRGESCQWKTFVANRVSEIQSLTDKQRWGHVISEENSADIISRGKPLSEFDTSRLWWQGPQWLIEGGLSPSTAIVVADNVPERRSSPPVALLVASDCTELIQRYSDLSTLQRVTAWCLRFVNNARKPKNVRESGPLKTSEIQNANYCLLKSVQAAAFSRELTELESHGRVRSGPLANLNVFIDNRGLIRVGGRLQNANLPYSQKHGVVLPPTHHYTEILIRAEHARLLHAGQLSVLNSLRSHYWILSGQSAIRRVLRRCVKCFRTRPTPNEQLMGNLPAARVNANRAFAEVGMDCAGPFTIKVSRNVTAKAYLCVFVCMFCKAVHLEIVSDLSTDAFLNAFKRFISRRGYPSRLYSDNGRNFLGARNELMKVRALLNSPAHRERFGVECTALEIEWHFSPPYAPHFGGLWEAAVKSAKTHWRKIVGNTTLSFEELTTVFTLIEAVMNSRPLSPLSADASDLLPLTPGHFLIGQALTALPQPVYHDTSANRLTRFGLIAQMQQHFWMRWSKEYLNNLQARNKWRLATEQLRVGAMVLLNDLNLPPLQWPMGRVVKLFPGQDNLVRVALVKTASGIVKRAIAKLSVLPIVD